MKTVQVAIPDPVYADCIRSVLSEDGLHQVQSVPVPDVSLPGVIILDAAHLNGWAALAREQKRLIVMAHKDRDELAKIWDAGVRHVVFYGDPPESVRVIVLGMELSLAASRAATT